MRAQSPDPGEDRRGVEAELGDDLDLEPGLRRGLELAGEQPVQLVVCDARMAIRIARDADRRDAVPRDQARSIASSAPWNGPAGSARSPAINEAAHARLAGEPVEEAPERLGGREVAHRCGTGSSPAAARRAALFDHLLLRPRRHRAEIHVECRRAGRP